MTLDKSGKLWRGENLDDLAECIRNHQAGGYSVATVVEPVCAQCGGRTFRININDDDAAQRACAGCGTAALIAGSAEHRDDTCHDECRCPCGGKEFAVAVGYAVFGDGEVRWISVGLRCVTDHVLGVCADLKIDYSPSRHLLSQA